MRTRKHAACCGGFAVIVLLLAGCVDTEQVQTTLDATQATLESLQTQQARIDEIIAGLPEGEDKAKAEEVRDLILPKIDAMRNTVVVLKDQLATAEDKLAMVQATGEAVAPFLPTPYNQIAIALIAFIVPSVRAWRNKVVAKKVIAAIDPYVSVPDDKKLTVARAQGTDGESLVAQAKGKVGGLPF